jgi:hypothetical protein
MIEIIQREVMENEWPKNSLESIRMRWSRTDTIQARSNSDFDIKNAPIQFYNNSHNSQSDRWIKPTFYVKYPNMLSYLGVKFQANQS